METKLEKFSFNSLIKEVGHIRIPKIQRDYAQGRRNKRVDEIRQVFIHSLMQVVNGNVEASELDFVYGSIKDNAFEPLDGQQRLTTLFLLHWMLGCKNLKDSHNSSVFTYETRNTSKDFCNELVKHKAEQFVLEAKSKSLKDEKMYRVSDIITNRDWYNWSWKFDPTIQSMLVMLDAIYDEMNWSLPIEECRDRLNNITFNRLNLGAFGLSNELFIKMNARGKELSDFDKMKSTLEEEIQQQKQERKTDVQIESDWRTMIDSSWIDLFWSKYAQNSEDGNMLRNAQMAEQQLKKLLLRLIAVQLFAKHVEDNLLYDATYRLDEQYLDNLIFIYQNSLLKERSEKSEPNLTRIDFGELIKDVNAFIYKDGESYKEITSLLSRQSHLEDNDTALFDSFLAPRVGNDTELVFYATLLYLRQFPIPDNDNERNCWLPNLEEWVKFVRNIIINDNLNQRIDKIQFVEEAFNNLTDLVAAFKATSPDVLTDSLAVRRFVSIMDIERKYNRLDNHALNEEKKKAELKLNNTEWISVIDKAEQHPFLWGQIRCLIGWSEEDIEKFEDYRIKLVTLLDNITIDYYAALLAVCGNEWTTNNRLYEFNKERRFGIKRHLRDKKSEDNVYAKLIKMLIDKWMSDYNDVTEAPEFYRRVIDDSLKNGSLEQWKQCILLKPMIMDYAWRKCIFDDNGHVIIAQQKTTDSHCYDPILLFLYILCEEQNIDSHFGDSKDDKPHSLDFTINYGTFKTFYNVQWNSSEKKYECRMNDGDKTLLLTPEKLVEACEKRINKISIKHYKLGVTQ